MTDLVTFVVLLGELFAVSYELLKAQAENSDQNQETADGYEACEEVGWDCDSLVIAQDAEKLVKLSCVIRLGEERRQRRLDIKEKEESDADEVSHEDAVVTHADAVVDPWTVMIPSLDTAIANAAVL